MNSDDKRNIPELPKEWHDWEIIWLIGSGSYGDVYLAQRTIGGSLIQCAVKIIRNTI